MQRIRETWNLFRNVAIILSFIVNIVLLVVIVVLVNFIFEIKTAAESELIDGLGNNFVELNEASIITDITVDDQIPISFNLALEQETNVVLSSDVSIPGVPATFNIDGGAGNITGTVDIVLPEGTILPVYLDLDVPVNEQIPILLNVPVNIPLNQTQLSPAFVGLVNVVEPYVKLLDRLPDAWGQTPDFLITNLQGEEWLAPGRDRNPLDTKDLSGTNQTGSGSGSGQNIQPTPTFTPFPSLTSTPSQ